jgi:4-diphosphocytidyl-2-C-methyl-D-erythritol kinase
MQIEAPAKINLFLRVVRRREDGYHEIETLFQAIGLADTLTFAPAPEGEFALACDDPSLQTDASNLVCRAAAALRAASRTDAGAHVTLTKRIPAGGGLGGGSSDAAATLLGLRQLWGLPLTDAALHDLAASLGSDIPFFLHGGTALATGRGEILTPLPDPPPLALVLVTPPFGVATPAAYRAWRATDDAGLPDIAACRDALMGGDWQRTVCLDALAATLRNDLEPGVFATHPELERIRQRLLAAGAVAARMTGSGSTLFALARETEHARRIAAAVADIPGRVVVTESLPTKRSESGLPPSPEGKGESSANPFPPSPVGRGGQGG